MDERVRERIANIESSFADLTLEGSRVKQIATEEFNQYNVGLNHVLSNPLALDVFLKMYETTIGYLEQIKAMEEGRGAPDSLNEILDKI